MKAFFGFSDRLYPAFYPLNNDIVINLTHPVMNLLFQYTPEEKQQAIIEYLGEMVEKEKAEPNKEKKAELERERYFMSTEVIFADGNLKKFLNGDSTHLSVEVNISPTETT